MPTPPWSTPFSAGSKRVAWTWPWRTSPPWPTPPLRPESLDPDDALHHATESYQDWEHDRAVAERDDKLAALPDLALTPMGDDGCLAGAAFG
jgi:hypothetical protein